MVSALVLAAGMSRRMGTDKLLLPWQCRTVIEQVVTTLAAAGLADILVVTGHKAEQVAAALSATPARCLVNPHYARGEMISSIQAGLAALAARSVQDGGPAAALLCLGDQPQMEVGTVAAVLAAGAAAGWERTIIPSYQMHGGHPILLPRCLWPAVLASDRHLRAILAAHSDTTDYLTVATPSILADLDTPEDYARGQAAL